MRVVELTDLHTVVLGLTALQIATFVVRRVPLLERLNVPSPVIGGVLGALCVAMVRRYADIEVQFAHTITDFMLLVFFTSIGLSAKLSALKAGGKPLVYLCAAVVILIILQNVVGIAVALGFGANPYYGLLVGSISFVGGPGTAAAWAKEAQAAGVTHASEVAIAAATMAVVVGALIAGPVVGWLVKRKGLRAGAAPSEVPWHQEQPGSDAAGAAAAPVAPKKPVAIPVERAMQTFLIILVAVLIG